MIFALVDNVTRRYAMGWEGAIFQRVCIGLVGLLVLMLAGRVTWKRDCSILTGILWLIAGGILVTFSAIPQKVIEFVISTEYLNRIRVIMGLVSILVLYITFESIRRTHLQEKYALLWVVTALIILISVLFPDAVSLFRAVTGMEYATAIATVSFTFLVMVAFHFSISLSAMQTDHTKVAQRVAILEARLKKLEETIAGGNDNEKKLTGQS
ncbi:MAG: DUF2304 domain-containing protein [Kiritimatiellae bacterium]|nr:DUF2304 domain-containing protein [Kiritimatiellia bacterium]MDD5522666.1 DUF2304 domain-containing protein [Kiritimatiellia bacterium]